MNQRIKKAFVDISNLDQWMANLIKLLNKVLTKKKKKNVHPKTAQINPGT